MRKEKQKEKVIAGMRSLGREMAAEYVGMSKSNFDRLVNLSKIGKANVQIKFIQLVKGGDIWFPVKFLDEFVEEVIERGHAICPKKSTSRTRATASL